VDTRDIVWSISIDTLEPVGVRSLTFGKVPAGYIEGAPARQLEPGCYKVGYAAKEATYFQVNANGHIEEISPQEARPDLWR